MKKPRFFSSFAALGCAPHRYLNPKKGCKNNNSRWCVQKHISGYFYQSDCVSHALDLISDSLNADRCNIFRIT